MLEELLKELESGKTLEVKSLAKKLGTTPALVEVMLEHLERSGRLKTSQGCEGGCSACGLKGACLGGGIPPGTRLWQG